MIRTLRPQLLIAAAVALFAATFLLATPASATHGQPGKQLPYRGVMAGPISVVYAPGFPFVRDTFGGRCSVPSDWTISFTLTGEVTHLGSFTSVGGHCSRLDMATGIVVFGDGVFTTTSANGDTLTGTYTNGYGPPDGTFTDDVTLTGGTGRFSGATGEAVDSGVADVTATPPTIVVRFDGWIAYDASQQG